MTSVRFDRVVKTYPDGTTAVNELSLEIADGEFMVLVGPSGCGKTTALRMLAGLEEITEGVLAIGDRVVNHVPSRDRDIAMVFQSYALYPHLIGLREHRLRPPRLKKLPKGRDRRARPGGGAHRSASRTFLKRKPRDALGRAAPAGRDGPRDRARAAGVPDGRAALEPRREAPRPDARRDQRASSATLGVTTIYVTHDQVEAMTMGDRVAVMRKGELQQVARAAGALRPSASTSSSAASSAAPAMNMVEATLERANGSLVAVAGERQHRVGAETLSPPDPRSRRTRAGA